MTVTDGRAGPAGGARTAIALAGIGKIARDQHIPAIRGGAAFELAATVSRSGGIDGVENHPDIAALLEARPDIGTVSLCMPPQPRHPIARACLLAGRNVMLEKPPGASVTEVQELQALAAARGVTLFATWHSRAANGVAPARAWLADRTVRHMQVTWREDVRQWHPGQDWVWAPGGLGVFDPGINALSIVSEILPAPVHPVDATLSFPANRDTPIAAAVRMEGPGGMVVDCDFDWRQEGTQTWEIAVETDGGTLRLTEGGGRMFLDDAEQTLDARGEYPRLYDRMAALLATGASDADLVPLQLVADIFLLGRRRAVEPFHD